MTRFVLSLIVSLSILPATAAHAQPTETPRGRAVSCNFAPCPVTPRVREARNRQAANAAIERVFAGANEQMLAEPSPLNYLGIEPFTPPVEHTPALVAMSDAELRELDTAVAAIMAPLND